jgi:hypothetical protein
MSIPQTSKDLYKARQNYTFPVKQLTYLIYDGPTNYAARQRCLDLIQNDPVLSKENRFFMGRTEVKRIKGYMI